MLAVVVFGLAASKGFSHADIVFVQLWISVFLSKTFNHVFVLIFSIMNSICTFKFIKAAHRMWLPYVWLCCQFKKEHGVGLTLGPFPLSANP